MEVRESEEIKRFVKRCKSLGTTKKKDIYNAYCKDKRRVNYKTFWKYAQEKESDLFLNEEEFKIKKAVECYNPPRVTLEDCFVLYRLTNGAFSKSRFIRTLEVLSRKKNGLRYKDMYKGRYFCNLLRGQVGKSLFDIRTSEGVKKEYKEEFFNNEDLKTLWQNTRLWGCSRTDEIRAYFGAYPYLKKAEIWGRFCEENKSISKRTFMYDLKRIEEEKKALFEKEI